MKKKGTLETIEAKAVYKCIYIHIYTTNILYIKLYNEQTNIYTIRI